MGQAVITLTRSPSDANGKLRGGLETTGLNASAHTLPPYMLGQYVVAALGSEVALLGIQPAQTDIGAPLSSAVATAVDEIVGTLAEILTGTTQ